MKKLIEKYLKKKKERAIFELQISNYNKSSFYIALVYNSKVDLYKVLYIPLDIVEDDISEYVCYQFIDLVSVEYILRMLADVKSYNGEYDFSSKKSTVYNIEINMDLLEKKYSFKATQFIPREWEFLFDVIVSLFGYVPHIVGGVCEDILTLFRCGEAVIPYQEIFEFELLRDENEKLRGVLQGQKLDYKKISYLENIGDKYYAIIDKHLVIVNYNKCGIVSVYCDTLEYVDYVYTVILAIRDEVEKKFSKIMVNDKGRPNLVQYYLCYGVCSKGLKVIKGFSQDVLAMNLYNEGLVQFTSDENGFEEKLK